MEILRQGIGLEDMAKLLDLQDKTILDNLKKRHECDLIYVSTSKLLHSPPHPPKPSTPSVVLGG